MNSKLQALMLSALTLLTVGIVPTWNQKALADPTIINTSQGPIRRPRGDEAQHLVFNSRNTINSPRPEFEWGDLIETHRDQTAEDQIVSYLSIQGLGVNCYVKLDQPTFNYADHCQQALQPNKLYVLRLMAHEGDHPIFNGVGGFVYQEESAQATLE
jgi:hypothetical protein